MACTVVAVLIAVALAIVVITKDIKAGRALLALPVTVRSQVFGGSSSGSRCLFANTSSEPVFAAVHSRTGPSAEQVEVLWSITVELLVLVDPKGTLAVHLSKVIKVELPNK